MATPYQNISVDKTEFFRSPAGKGLSITTTFVTVVLCMWAAEKFTAPEAILRTLLLTVPPTLYLMARSFVWAEG